MLKQLKRKIENRESLHELRDSMSDLKEEEKELVYSYYHFFNGNYGNAAIAFANAIDALPVEDVLADASILYFSFGDFLCWTQCVESCDTCAEGVGSCSCCGGRIALVCGAMLCVTCMKNAGMEGSCCWNIFAGIQDCICGCICETIPELIYDCVCGVWCS